MNFDRLRFVAERAELGEQREALLRGDDPRASGQLPALLRAARRAQRHRVQLPLSPTPRQAHVFVGLEVARPRRDGADRCAALQRATASRRSTCPTTRWPSCTCATWSAAARRRPSTRSLYRFEFPERPGALMRFLDSMSAGWNISLFHYRNHGADYGRVLVGMQVPPRDSGAVPRVPRPARLRLRRRDGQPGLSHVPRPLGGSR